MKIKLPFVLRSTYERETNELVSDIKVLEGVKDASNKKIESLKSDLQEFKDLSYLTVTEKNSDIESLKLALEKRDKEREGMKWCIQERYKELDKVKAFNMDLYKKVELSGEMYRQFKDKVDKACEIEFVTRIITHEDIKKFMKVEDIIQLYTLVGIEGK